MNKPFVAHIVPTLDIGGVETAIFKSREKINSEFTYKVYYVRKRGILDCNQSSVWSLLLEVILKRNVPNIVITSLWWSHPIGYLLKLFGSTWVSFFHSANFAHHVDKSLAEWAWMKSQVRLVDSIATSTVFQKRKNLSCTIIPYVFLAKNTPKIWSDRQIDLIWIGRSHKVKRIDLLISFLKESENYASYKIVIAISGKIPNSLIDYAQFSKHKIQIKENIENTRILSLLNDAKVYILFSDYEGMSMSTIEAIQAGCITALRRVGEIYNYLSENDCIDIKDDKIETIRLTAKKVHQLCNDEVHVNRILCSSIESVNKLPTYTECFLNALRRIG